LLFVHLLRGDTPTAYQFAQRLQQLAQEANDSGLLLSAHLTSGNVLCAGWHHGGASNKGDRLRAQEHLEAAISLYDPECHRQLRVLGGDVMVNPRSVLGHALWWLGYPDRALKSCTEALAIAQSAPIRQSRAFAQSYLAELHFFRREARTAQESAERLIALSTEYGFPLWLAVGTKFRGWAIAVQGNYEDGIALIRQGLAGMRATETTMTRASDLLLLADACIEAGRSSEALDVLAEARTLITQREHHICAVIELFKGKLLSRSGAAEAAEAEHCFRSSIEIARKSDDKMTDLRAATGLMRLLASRGGHDEARAILSDIYNWFTEGFDTADLKEAKAVLEELGQRPSAPGHPNGRPLRGGPRQMRIQ
jgi:predicted ATPase